jgi:hypothetical protein
MLFRRFVGRIGGTESRLWGEESLPRVPVRGAGTVAAARGEREKEPELLGSPHARKSKSEIFSTNKPANNWSSSGLTSPGAVENPESTLCVLPTSEVGESRGESPQLLALVEISPVPVSCCSSGTTDSPPSSSARRASRARLQSQSAREKDIPGQEGTGRGSGGYRQKRERHKYRTKNYNQCPK